MNASNSVGAILCAKCGKFHRYSMECEDKAEIARLRAELTNARLERDGVAALNSSLIAELAAIKERIATYWQPMAEAWQKDATAKAARIAALEAAGNRLGDAAVDGVLTSIEAVTELAAAKARIAELEKRPSEEDVARLMWQQQTTVAAFIEGAKARAESAEARCKALRETIRKIRATDNITAVWHIADAALAPSPAGREG